MVAECAQRRAKAPKCACSNRGRALVAVSAGLLQPAPSFLELAPDAPKYPQRSGEAKHEFRLSSIGGDCEGRPEIALVLGEPGQDIHPPDARHRPVGQTSEELD